MATALKKILTDMDNKTVYSYDIAASDVLYGARVLPTIDPLPSTSA